MSRYYFYRIQKEYFEESEDLENVKIDYLPILSEKDDKFIIFVSQSLEIIGAYKKEGEVMVLEKVPSKTLTIRDFYDKLSIITEITERTYKVFAKKAKEISKEDYELILKAF